jgi:hypothetical protein
LCWDSGGDFMGERRFCVADVIFFVDGRMEFGFFLG